MDFFDNEYYRHNQYLMSLIGLWPYQEPKRRLVRLLCVSAIFIQTLLMQLAPFFTNDYSASLFVDVISFIIFTLAFILKYNVVYLKSNHVRKIYDQIQLDWNLIQNLDELKIIQKYACKIRFYTILSGSFVYLGSFIFFLIMFTPDVFNIIAPLDEPRSRQSLLQIECFFDQEKYFYIFAFMFLIIQSLDMIILMATETMCMIFIQHACGLFELTSYRITRAFDKISSRSTSTRTKYNVCTMLSCAFNTHQQCLKFIKNISSRFSTCYFILCIFGVASLSINMMRFFKSVMVHNIFHSIVTGTFIFAHLCYFFWLNYFGQDLIDHSEYLFQQIYSAQWYMAPLYAQKLLFIMLQRSMKDSQFIIGNLFTASLEGFFTLMSMSLSYCMVMYSVYN